LCIASQDVAVAVAIGQASAPSVIEHHFEHILHFEHVCSALGISLEFVGNNLAL
jgi:hypothetical protein